MRYTEQEIETMEQYETLQANHLEIEESLQRGSLWLEERNAMEHLLDLATSELEDARADLLAVFASGHP